MQIESFVCQMMIVEPTMLNLKEFDAITKSAALFHFLILAGLT